MRNVDRSEVTSVRNMSCASALSLSQTSGARVSVDRADRTDNFPGLCRRCELVSVPGGVAGRLAMGFEVIFVAETGSGSRSRLAAVIVVASDLMFSIVSEVAL